VKIHDDIRQRLLNLDIEAIDREIEYREGNWSSEEACMQIDEIEDIINDVELDRKYADLAETIARMRT
jgi:hypothetical protein